MAKIYEFPQQEVLLTMKGFLLMSLLMEPTNEATTFCKKLMAQRLWKNGFPCTEDDLKKYVDNAVLGAEFSEMLYTRGYWNDSDSEWLLDELKGRRQKFV